MRFVPAPAVLAAGLLLTFPARAQEAAPAPDPAVALLVGGATIFAGFAAGATVIATGSDLGSPSDAAARQTQIGWWVMESGFALAPLTAHAVVGEWGRGALFSAVPTAAALGTIPVFAEQPSAVEHGTLEEQRVMYVLYGVALLGAVAGVVDAALAPGRRAVQVAPMVGSGRAGLVLGGTL
jgi:hypothetical protein